LGPRRLSEPHEMAVSPVWIDVVCPSKCLGHDCDNQRGGDDRGALKEKVHAGGIPSAIENQPCGSPSPLTSQYWRPIELLRHLVDAGPAPAWKVQRPSAMVAACWQAMVSGRR
jgi:hypothetical protein